MRRAFTMVELMLAVVLLGVMTVSALLTFRAVTTGWRVSREYLDRLERTDYAIDQLVSGLKCAYYPHAGSQNEEHGFVLTDNGNGENPDDSDLIEWSKKGSAMIGGSAAGDSVHRIQVMVLEEGDNTWGERIETTGLYARVKPMAKVMVSDTVGEEDDFSFSNNELYRPILIAKGVEGFNCQVQAKPPDDSSKKEDSGSFEDEYSESNSVPYKVQLTFYIAREDPEYLSQKKMVPVMRTVRIPVHEQSQDGAGIPGEEEKKSGGPRTGTGGKPGGNRPGGNRPDGAAPPGGGAMPGGPPR